MLKKQIEEQIKEPLEECDKEKNILIVTGGSIDYNWAEKWLKNRIFDYVIAADSGLVHADKLGLKVDYILGDYDSVDNNVLEEYRKDTTVVTYPQEKDYTDTHIAIIRALEQNASQISIIGATGSRYDHAMTNIFIMKAALEVGVKCAIYDKNNKIYLADKYFEISRKRQYGEYVSFLPVSQEVCLTLEGMKYPLKEYVLKQGLSICQSNEVVEEIAKISVKNGIVVVFETKD